jgi:pilus assembly protein CpaB
MRMIFGVVLLFGIGLAGLAVHMTQNYVNQHKSALQQAQSENGPAVRTVPIIVASKKLKYGEKITLDKLSIVQWPSAALPDGTFSTAEELFPKDTPGDRYVMRSTEKNEALLAVKITKPGQEVGLNARLEKGQRAFTIKVDVSSGVSGFLRPGDAIDIYWTGKVQNGSERGSRNVSRLILPSVQIIAIDQSADEEIRKVKIARTVTVAVPPQNVADLTLAQSTGRLALSLVGHSDDTIASVEDVDKKQLLGIEAAQPVAQVEQEKVCTIRTRKGAEVHTIKIPCTN